MQFCHADVSVDVTLFLLGGGVSKSRVLLNSLQQGSLNSVCLHFTTAVKMFLNMVHLPPKAIMRVASPVESSGLSTGCGGEQFVHLLHAWSGLEAKKESGGNDLQIS